MLLPALSAIDSSTKKAGAMNAVSQLVEHMQDRLLPYIFLFVVPTMRCMSDQNPAIRSLATSSFAYMVSLLPLAQVCPCKVAHLIESIPQIKAAQGYLHVVATTVQGSYACGIPV